MTSAAEADVTVVNPPFGAATRRGKAIRTALLVVLATVPFLATLRGPFFWDDAANVEFNRSLRSVEGLLAIWVDPLASFQYYPLTYSLFWFEFQLFGESPFGYHVVNLSLHAFNAILAWRALRALRAPAPWWTAALFAVHPIQVETVGWITEQKNLLSTMFAILAILQFERFQQGAGLGRLGLASAAFTAALASKTVVVVIPIFLLLSELLRRRSSPSRWAPPLLVWLSLGVAAGMVTSWRETATSNRTGSPADTPPRLELDERILLASQSVWRYVGLVLCLEPFVPIPVRSAPSWNNPLAVQSLVGALLVSAVAAARAFRGKPDLLLALSFFALNVGPTLGLLQFQFQCHSFVADHFAYFAVVGVFAITCGTWFTDFSPARRSIAACVLIALSATTWKQSVLFANPERLWKATIEANPAAWSAYTNLANLLLKRGALQEAAAAAAQAVEIEPADAMGRLNLGMALGRLGRLRDAERELREAARIAPDDPRFRHNLGLVLFQQQRWHEAIEEFRIAADGAPYFPMTHYLMGEAFRNLGMTSQAQRCYRRALDAAPDMDVAKQALDAIRRPSEDQAK
jgi:tetratricopeptide (TPR) repeat protein